jgi:hypothetical protein
MTMGTSLSPSRAEARRGATSKSMSEGSSGRLDAALFCRRKTRLSESLLVVALRAERADSEAEAMAWLRRTTPGVAPPREILRSSERRTRTSVSAGSAGWLCSPGCASISPSLVQARARQLFL